MLPFLPGLSLNPTGPRPRKQFFSREDGVVSEKVDLNSTRAKRESAFGRTKSESTDGPAQPAWLAFAGQALRFSAFFKEAVTESRDEHYRVRRVIIVVHLEDNSVSVVEPPSQNSGAPDGKLVRRHRVPLPNDPSDFYLPDDFAIGREVEMYGRVYRIVDCDEFTRNYFAKMGLDVGTKEDYPEDLYSRAQQQKEKTKQRITMPKPDMDGKKQFLLNDKNVLEFYAQWKENKLFSEPRRFKLDYFLADDSIQVVEIHQPNSGRDQSGPFLRKQRLPKPDEKSKSVVRDPTAATPEYYHWRDLKVGDIIDVLGRNFLLYDCDPHTKKFYLDQVGVVFQPLSLQGKERAVFEVADPPYNGWGSEEDSLLSSKTLEPRVVKQDMVKMLADDKAVIRFASRLVSRSPEDKEREFVVTFFLADNTLSVFEPPRRNSGMVGGKFLERGRVKKYGTNEYFKAADLYVGATIAVNGHTFILLETDEFSLNVMESRTADFPRSDLALIHAKLREAARGVANPSALFDSVNGGGKDHLTTVEFTQALRSLQGMVDLSDQEIIHLVRHYDVNGDGLIQHSEFLAVLSGRTPAPRNISDVERERKANEPPLIKPHLVRDAIKDSIHALNESLRARRGQLLASFRDFDLDRDGKLNLTEFRGMLGGINLALSTEQKDQLVNHFFDDEVVKSSGNAVTYQRFVVLLQREPTAQVIVKGINSV